MPIFIIELFLTHLMAITSNTSGTHITYASRGPMDFFSINGKTSTALMHQDVLDHITSRRDFIGSLSVWEWLNSTHTNMTLCLGTLYMKLKKHLTHVNKKVFFFYQRCALSHTDHTVDWITYLILFVEKNIYQNAMASSKSFIKVWRVLIQIILSLVTQIRKIWYSRFLFIP